MSDRNELFRLLNRHLSSLDQPSFYNSFMSEDEECPFCTEVFSDMQKSVTFYREETIRIEVPDDVHIRLHQVIRRQWFGSAGEDDKL